MEIPNQAYRTLVTMDRNGKYNWVTKVILLLQTTVVGYAWLAQGVGNESRFVQTFRQRLLGINSQDWEAGLNASSGFDLYRDFKTMPNPEYYQSHYILRYLYNFSGIT